MEGSSSRRTPARAAALACAFLLALGTAPNAVAGPGIGPVASPGEVDEAVAFRAKLGFRADRAYVAATFGNHDFSKARWGVPLDSGEAAEVGRRVRLQKDAGRALDAWAEEPGTAGAYFDHGARGAPVFLTTRDPAKAKGAVAKAMPAGANARFLRVQHSTAELLAVQARVNADMDAGALAALGVTSTAIDARANAVVVGVAAETDAVREALAARYGAAVTAVFEAPAQGGDACAARDDCSPAKAGIEIRSSYNGNNCTTGFLVQIAGGSEARVLTAGHCIGKSGGTGTTRKWTHDGIQTWAELSTWTDGADADVGVLAADGSAISGARNLLYRATSNDIIGITGFASNTQQIQGGLVCRSAAISSYRCGTIVLTNRTKDVDGRTIDHQWVVDYDACPGDSGAPYLLDTVAYGLHSDSTFGCDPSTNQAWYSPIGWVLDVLEDQGHPVELCTTATCGAGTNAWTTQGSLDGATWRPQLVSLADGRVLKAGGDSGDLLAADAGATAAVPEVFDPDTGAWTDASNPPWLPAACDGQFAVRIPDGRVLSGGGRKVGGSGGADLCDGAHLYNPSGGGGGSWSTVSPPPTPVESAAAVLLADGRVFVTGGAGADGATPIAMAWDPDDDAWTTLASPPAGAFAPLALVMGDDRVLVTGGYVVADEAGPGYADVTATHIYNPDTNAWAGTSAIGARGIAGTVLSNGRVVVAGGMHLSWDGSQHVSFLTNVRQFDPGASSWSSLASLASGRAGVSLAQLEGGFLVVAGGLVAGGAAGTPTTSTVAWDPAGKAWHSAGALHTARAEHGTAVLDDGSLLVAGGGTASSERFVLGDLLPPTAGTPSTALRAASTLGTTSLPVRIWWSASDVGGSGVGTFDVARSTDGGSYTTIATKVPTTSYSTTVVNGHRYRFRVRPRDYAGNVGAWKIAAEVRGTIVQQTSGSISYGSGWTTDFRSSFSGGSARYATAAGRSASYTFTGRDIGFVTTKGPTRGSVKIYIDGTFVDAISLYSSSISARYVAFHRTFSSSGRHTIKLVLMGSTGHPRVDLDAFEVLANP